MCGIAGIVNKDGAPARKEIISRVTDTLAHRGPDGSGIHCDGNIAIGHRRLAIIDLEGGVQPLSNENGTIWITYNGEIYNFRELKSQLEAKGHIFKTHSDTEVIVHAYEDWGEACLERLRGMFAFAIWDSNRKRLFLARDRIGIKPLYYLEAGNTFAFSSELQAFKRLVDFRPELDLQALDMYLQFQYIPAPFSIYKEVRKLKPAHFLIVDQKGACSEQKRYWDLTFKPDYSLTEEKCLEGLDAALKETVQAHLVSDVPFGAFLSGGVDSSTVVAYMSQVLEEPVRTFSVGYDTDEYDETRYSKKVAERFKTEHHVEIVRPDAMSILPELVEHYGEPFADSSAISVFYISRFAREYVKMVLSGDGGDELFAGYYSYISLLYQHRKPSKIFQRLKHCLGNAARKVNVLHPLPAPSDTKYGRMAYFNASMRDELWLPEFSHLKENTYEWFKDEFNGPRQPDPLSRHQYFDITHYIPYDNLTKVDIASMYHGLEVRVPLLDHVFLDFVTKIPPGLKLSQNGRGTAAGKKYIDFEKPIDSVSCKYILKKNGERFLAHEFWNRPKRGFEVPLRPWFRKELKDILKERLTGSSSALNGLFDLEYIGNLITEHVQGTDNAWRLWALLFLNEWIQQNKKNVSIG